MHPAFFMGENVFMDENVSNPGRGLQTSHISQGFS